MEEDHDGWRWLIDRASGEDPPHKGLRGKKKRKKTVFELNANCTLCNVWPSSTRVLPMFNTHFHEDSHPCIIFCLHQSQLV